MLLKWLVVTNVPAGNVWNWTTQPRLVVNLGRLIHLSIDFIQLWQSCIKIFYQFSEVEVSWNLQKNYCGLFWNILPNFSNINQLDWRYFTNIRSESEPTLPHFLYWLYLYWIICNIYKEIININLIFYHETSK